MLFACKNGEHHSFTSIYFIPQLTANIVSVGQLDEVRYKINIDARVMRIQEHRGRLLAKVAREENRLYMLDIKLARPVCLAARGEESA